MAEAERQQIMESMAGDTLSRMFWRRAEALGSCDAQLVKRQGTWRALTWSQVGEAVREAALGLLVLGRSQQETVALLSASRAEWVQADFAILNIAPLHVERLLKRHPLIGEAMVYGDRRPYPVALVALDPDTLRAFARRRGIRHTEYAELTRDRDVIAWVEVIVQAVNAELQSPARVKRFAVIPATLTEETGELTPTQKVKRRVVAERYRDLIESLYR